VVGVTNWWKRHGVEAAAMGFGVTKQ